jgi:RHS repeat-associated protein
MPVTKYIWDGENCLMETDGNGAVQTVYTYEPEQYGNLISSRVSGTTYYHHYDALGSTRQLSNAAGAVSDTWIYDAWGNTILRTGTTGIAASWIGERGYCFDSSLGIFAVRLRQIETGCARWLSIDPFEFVDSQNRYLYVSNKPLMRVDPSGLTNTFPFLKRCPCKPGTKAKTEVGNQVPTGGNTSTDIGIQIAERGRPIDLGFCGEYDWRIWWNLLRPAPAIEAFIIQHIRTETKVFDCDGAVLAARNIEFWEAFELAPGMTITTNRRDGRFRYDDKYSGGPHRSCTTGYIKVTGEYTMALGWIPPTWIRDPTGKSVAGYLPHTFDPNEAAEVITVGSTL